jgi:colicin import membrane protein
VDPVTAPPEPVEATNPVSIFPDKRKIKKAQDVRLEEDKVQEREAQERQAEEKELKKKIEERRRDAQQRQQEEKELEKKIEERRREAEQKDKSRREAERQKILAQAKIDQIRAENEARQAAAEARKLEAEARAARDALGSARTEAARQTQAMQNALTHTSTGRQQAQSLVEKQYEAAVASRVKSFWVLPEMRTWDAGLLAQVVVTINKEGEVMSIQFDQRSKDPLFDQLVENTIKSATPMPRFPAVMQQETIEIGLKFRPGELGNM